MKAGRKGVAIVLALMLTASTWLPGTQAVSAGLQNFQTVRTYTTGRFSDVPAGEWYEENVKTAYELNLLQGSGAGTFHSEGDITIAETLAVACRIHSIYQTGQAAFTQGEPWYQVYVDYGVKNGIITEHQFSNYNIEATRRQFAAILAKALPDTALNAINTIEDGAIPDLAQGSRYYQEIYCLYRAGVLTGNDTRGTFEPDSDIQRVEAAAIVSRMALPSMRRSLTLRVVPVEEVVLNKTSVEVEQGDSVTLSSAVMPANATNFSVVWTSSSPSVATVTSRGVVTGFQTGTTTITATAHNGVKASCSVRVKSRSIPVDSVSIAQSTITLARGEEMTLYYNIKPSNATDRSTTWSSSDTSVATVNSGGQVTARGEGTATITLKSSNGKTDTCRVTVKPTVTVTSVSLYPSSVVMETGETKTLSPTIRPENAGNQSLAWKSSNSSVATVNADGLVTAVGKGSAIITAKAHNGKYATCRVTVRNPELPLFSVPELEYNYGPMTVTSYYTDGAVQYVNDLSWLEFTETTSQSDPNSAYFKVILEGTSSTSKVYIKINLCDDAGRVLDSDSIGALVAPGETFRLEQTVHFSTESLPKAAQIEFTGSSGAAADLGEAASSRTQELPAT